MLVPLFHFFAKDSNRAFSVFQKCSKTVPFVPFLPFCSTFCDLEKIGNCTFPRLYKCRIKLIMNQVSVIM